MLLPGQHIHIVGVGGFGMSAIARVLLQQGYTVSGSDLRANDFTRDLAASGATIFLGHAADHITGADLVVITSAAMDDNPEVAAARAQGIPVLKRRDVLSELMAHATGIAVAGTHGKTTTTAMIAHVLLEAGLDPTYIVGGVLRNTGTNAAVGRGAYFVIEADEYDRMFLGLRPQIAVVTNIEHDHPDCYPTLEDTIQAFRQFVDLLPEGGLLVACADDPAARRLGEVRQAAGKPVVWYGLGERPSPPAPLPPGEGSALTPGPSPLGRGAAFRRMASKAMVAAARKRRQRQTPTEATLWTCLRDRRLGGLKFRRQHPLANRAYIVDFFCYQAKLVIEIDGPAQEDQMPVDAVRQRDLESLGYRVLRFAGDQIAGDLESVLTAILAAAYPPGVPLPDEDGSGARAEETGDWTAEGLEPEASGGIRCVVRRGNRVVGPVRLTVPGQHNVQNALAAIAVADHLGIPFEKTAAALASFLGAGRRSEPIGQAGGVTVISDYAHHPTEIRMTLAAHRDRPGVRDLWAVWQPHTYGRMRALASDFAQAFGAADHVLVTDVYSVRETVSPGLDAAGMAQLIRAAEHPDVRYTGALDATARVLVGCVRPGDLVVLLSAGDAPQIGEQLVEQLSLTPGPSRAAERQPKGEAGGGQPMTDPYQSLFDRFGAALKRDEPLARYTVARLGGPADALLIANSTGDLSDAVMLAHREGIPWIVLGGGANVLIADAGYRGLVVVNHTKGVRFEESGRVVAESGVSLATLARRCINQGLGGLEWAVNIPGTVGGAVVNNAGAHGGDMAGSVRWVEIFSLEDRPHIEVWGTSQMRYGYRTSALKGNRGTYIVLTATLVLEPGQDPDELNAKSEEYVAYRKRTQPPGASLGSIFKNPPDDYAGRLVEAAGLKGAIIGGVQISPVHANFIVNSGEGTAADYRALIELARRTVQEKLGVTLELEIELIGAWE
jgi:UDP-N-acetylmuramate dehydrogenase